MTEATNLKKKLFIEFPFIWFSNLKFIERKDLFIF